MRTKLDKLSSLTGARALPEVGLGSGRIVYSQVDCTGHEESLSECNKTEVISSWCLSHEHDVGVICLDG